MDAISPQAAIYLTVKFALVGYSTAAGTPLADTSAVTQYLLDEAHLAVVPFSALGAPPTSPWYRLSVGTLDEAIIGELLDKLRVALDKLVKPVA